MTKQQLYTEVKKEAAALLIHATEKERGRLDFETLDATHVLNCIYGKMTGDCYSERAVFLITKCCSVYSDDLPYMGATLERCQVVETFARNRAYSPIEVYICLPDAKPKELIQYLKGETKTFKP